MQLNEWLEGHRKLLHPPFKRMTQEERLLRVAMMAYAGLQLNSQHLAEHVVSDALWDEICNTLGDDMAVAWSEKISDEAEQPDIDDD